MFSRVLPVLGAVMLLTCADTARAHYNMLLASSASVKRGEAVTLLYQWGHPFEHQLFDAPAPESLTVIAPDGKKTNLTSQLKTTAVAGDADKKVGAYEVRFTPEQRGDYLFVLQAAAIWMEEEQEFYQDTVKVVLHVQVQRHWDEAAGAPFELVPLTRPYGLQPGMVFQTQAKAAAKALAGALVEIEHYNPAPPKKLPPDEHITRTVKTGPNGVATATLTEPGWWAITAQRLKGQRAHAGKDYPVRQRTTLWVFVDGAIWFTEAKPSAKP